MKYYDNSLCSVTSLVAHRCVVYISNQHKYLVMIMIDMEKNCNRSSIIFNFVVTPRNFIIAKLSIRKPGSSSVLIMMKIRAYGSKALR